MDDARSEHGGLLTGVALALVGIWAWAFATGPTVVRLPMPESGEWPLPDLGLMVVPIAIAILGLAAGFTAWAVLAEHRIPHPRLRHGRGRAYAWPIVAASIAAWLVGQLISAIALTPVWFRHVSPDGSELISRTSPLGLAVDLSVVLLTWTVAYLLGRFVMGDADDAPATAIAPAT